jgi:hypothetical protein
MICERQNETLPDFVKKMYRKSKPPIIREDIYRNSAMKFFKLAYVAETLYGLDTHSEWLKTNNAELKKNNNWGKERFAVETPTALEAETI